jgi:hypothetical protein
MRQTSRHKRVVPSLDQHGLITRRGRKLLEPFEHFADRNNHSLEDGLYLISQGLDNGQAALQSRNDVVPREQLA